MSPTYTVVEATTAIRDHLRTELVDGSTIGSVYAAGLPSSPTYPAVTIRRVGGAPVGPVDAGLYQLDVWAPTAPTAAVATSAVLSWLESLGTVHLDDLSLVGAVTDSVIYLDDPNPDLHRYTITSTIHTRAHHPA